MIKKQIFVRHYSCEAPRPSELIYESELRRFNVYIQAIKKAHPNLSDAETYLAFKNLVSSQNIFSIEEVECE